MRIFLAATTTAMNKEDRAETFTQYKPKYFLETFFAGETICKRVLADCGDVENFLLDNGLFSFIAFLGVLPVGAIVSIVVGATLLEILTEIAIYPMFKPILKRLKAK